jgi:hypothetical protein
MKKYFILTCLLFVCSICLSQKVKIKNDIASVDKVPFLKFTTITFGSDYSIKHVNAQDEEISMLYLNYNDPNQTGNGNPNGTVRWIEVNFLPFNLKCEIDSRNRKQFTKLIYLSKIYENGQLNKEKVEQFVQKYGTKFSDNRPTGNTIIINNNN